MSLDSVDDQPQCRCHWSSMSCLLLRLLLLLLQSVADVRVGALFCSGTGCVTLLKHELIVGPTSVSVCATLPPSHPQTSNESLTCTVRPSEPCRRRLGVTRAETQRRAEGRPDFAGCLAKCADGVLYEPTSITEVSARGATAREQPLPSGDTNGLF